MVARALSERWGWAPSASLKFLLLESEWLLCNRFQGVVLKIKHGSTFVNASETSRLLTHEWASVNLLCKV